MQIIVALLALSFLVLVHEVGHFLAAKLLGVKVLEFSIFMGPKLFSFKRGETVYSIRSIPMGGYVKMEGEEQASEDERAFNKKPLRVRAAVILAGPAMNFIVAVLFITTIFASKGFVTTTIDAVLEGMPAYEAGIRANDRILKVDGKRVNHPMDITIFMYGSGKRDIEFELARNGSRTKTIVRAEKIPAHTVYAIGFSSKVLDGRYSNIVENVIAGSPAQAAGLKAGDKIAAIGGKRVEGFSDIKKRLQENGEKPVVITVIRENEELELGPVVPVKVEVEEQDYNLGADFKFVRKGLLGSIGAAVNYTYSVARSSVYSLVWMLTGKLSLKEVMGPVGIVNTIGDVVEMSETFADSVLNLISITAFISINLAMFNIIPIPALDGSKLVLFALEAIRRKPISPEKEALISMVGFVILILLMIFTVSNDILRIMGKALGG